ncbi:hypothetical protein ACCT14_33805 [Rhizobium brockwellii]|jgi:hypothetical protein|uniref:hypothetical protein n=1 Tax=Rhizobium brockwellii TaxID=3019932 RepID=UPI003F969381
MIVVSIKHAVSVVGTAQHERILLRALSLDIHRDDRMFIEWKDGDERDSLKQIIVHGTGHVSGEIRFLTSRRPCIKNYLPWRFREDRAIIRVLDADFRSPVLELELSTRGNFDAVVVFSPEGSHLAPTSFNRAYRLVDGRLLSF